jgi:putative ABC transport system permease protein
MRLLRLWRVLRRHRQDQAVLQQELSVHLEALEAEYRSHGLSADAAQRAARLRFGNLTAVHEDVREQFSFGALERVVQDTGYALRTFKANPGFAVFTVLIMSLGVGATTTMFSVVYGVLLRPLPFQEPARLVMLEEKWLPRFPRFEASPLDFVSWQQETTSFSELAAFKDVAFTLTSDERPEPMIGARVSANLPALLGVEPVIGRSFRAEEDRYGAGSVVLLSHTLWRRRFGADPAVIGRSARLYGLNYTIRGTRIFPTEGPAWIVRRHRADFGHDRNLRRHRLLGGATHAGDWSAPGSWRRSNEDSAADVGADDAGGIVWPDSWSDRILGGIETVAEPAL